MYPKDGEIIYEYYKQDRGLNLRDLDCLLQLIGWDLADYGDKKEPHGVITQWVVVKKREEDAKP